MNNANELSRNDLIERFTQAEQLFEMIYDMNDTYDEKINAIKNEIDNKIENMEIKQIEQMGKIVDELIQQENEITELHEKEIAAIENSDEFDWAINFLPKKYRYIDVIKQMKTYLLDMRADALKEAINLYEAAVEKAWDDRRRELDARYIKLQLDMLKHSIEAVAKEVRRANPNNILKK